MSISRQVRRAQERSIQKGKPAFTGFTKKPEIIPSETLTECALVRDGVPHHGYKSHSRLRESLGDTDPYTAKPEDLYGFWTSENRFVNRREAAQIFGWTARRELLSADVW